MILKFVLCINKFHVLSTLIDEKLTLITMIVIEVETSVEIIFFV